VLRPHRALAADGLWIDAVIACPTRIRFGAGTDQYCRLKEKFRPRSCLNYAAIDHPRIAAVAYAPEPEFTRWQAAKTLLPHRVIFGIWVRQMATASGQRDANGQPNDVSPSSFFVSGSR
jgi:hypothetical protein